MADENKQDNTGSEEKNNPDLEYIIKSGGVISRGQGETIHCLTIIGQIEGHYVLSGDQKATKYEHIIPLLVSIEESREIDGMLVVLNTMGGDVEAGLAIAEMIASMKKPAVTLVLGGGHSIGVYNNDKVGIHERFRQLASGAWQQNDRRSAALYDGPLRP